MKKIVTYLFCGFLFVSCFTNNPHEFRIDNSFTEEQITRLVDAALEDGVDIHIDELVYSSKGKILSIKGSVQSGTNSGHFESNEFAQLIITTTKTGLDIEIK